MNDWESEPRHRDARRLGPEVAPHRSRKNRRRWCRGKVGVEHGPLEVILQSWAVAMSDRLIRPTACFRPRWHPGTWICLHVERCATCGRHLRDGLGRACPDWSAEVTHD